MRHLFILTGSSHLIGLFLIALAVSVVLTWLFRMLARRTGFIDQPDQERKKHARPVALLGGPAIALSFWGIIGYYAYAHRATFFEKIEPRQLMVAALATALIIVIGVLDERYNLSPKIRFIVTLLIVSVALLGGIGLQGITNPLGGTIGLDYPAIRIPFFKMVLVAGDIIVFAWLLGMMYTTKLLDGLDGLVAGISAIGGLMIFFLTRTVRFFQPDVGTIALVFSAVCLGFLIFNFKPASIFLGESGSLFLGFMLGVLAVISGGKIATTLIVVAIPALDVVRVIIVRLLRGRPISLGDREHLHFRLLDRGYSERTVVLLLYAVAALCGGITLFLQSTGKLITLSILALGMLVLSIFFYRRTPYSS